MTRLLLCALSAASLLACPAAADSPTPAAPARTFEIVGDEFQLDGELLQIRCGEIHSARVPRAYWRHRLQMCKAMGLNTVCAYLFWNYHEPLPGQFNWEGRADVAEFCRLAQEEGLWVILRPGPYACAEWTMGGLPWWLLKEDDIQLRSRDLRFLKSARDYLAEVGRVLAPLQVTRGGPILMVQAENEYGFYSNDAEYMGEIRQGLLDAGFEVPLFACNPVQHLRRGYRDDLFSVVNFGSNPKGGFAALRRVMPEGPLMCGEYYSGWFDTWGNPHHTGNTPRYLADLDYMLERGASFSIYMAHGGTSFGLWAGADRPFKPDTSCYDYDAPITEAGWTTPKFFQSREVMGRYLLPGETLPDPPAANPVITVDSFDLTERAALLENLPAPTAHERPPTYEDLDLAAGVLLYRTTAPAGPACRLTTTAVHDAAWVLLDGKPVGVLDRRKKIYRVDLPARSEPARLDILVNAMGRVNFGREVHDRKGIHGPVELVDARGTRAELTGWETFAFPMNAEMLARLEFSDTPPSDGAAFYRGGFEVDEPGDTFLDMRPWGKGIAWVNGHCLGRFWNIGPVQTLYVPGVWLKAGRNEVIVFDLLAPTSARLAGREKPIMDQLRPDLDFAGEARKNRKLLVENAAPVATGEFAPGDAAQTIEFGGVRRGRHFCLESLSAFGGRPFAGAAELDLLDGGGEPISHEGWTIAYVSSEERIAEDGTAENAIDGQTANHWHTQWRDRQPVHPHRLVIDLGRSVELTGLRYVPRTGAGRDLGGRIKEYRLYVGDDLVE